jgi:hypothetical protein
MALAHHTDSTRRISTSLIVGAGLLGAVAVALVFGASPLDIAKFGAPHNVALQAAQIGLGAPAQAAPAAVQVAYLPAQLAVRADRQNEELPPQF